MKLQDNEFITIVLLTIAFGVLYWIFKIQAFLVLSAIILFSGMLSKTLRRIISNAWLRFGHFIGRINSKILLSLVFFAVLTPLAYVKRLFSSKQKKEKVSGTNWHTRNHLYTPEDLEKMW